MKENSYKISDSLWGRVTQYATAVWDSWGKDVDEYVEDVMDTDSRSDEELVISTVTQDSAHSVELVAHLVGSVFSNDYTKERVEELGERIADTQSYQSARESLGKLEETINKASEQFMQEHPKVQSAYMATEDRLEDTIDYVIKEAQTFSKNHEELSHDVRALFEIVGTLPAIKAGKVAMHVTEEVASIDTLKYLDKAHKHPIEIRTATPRDRTEWQEISEEMYKNDKRATASGWMWDKHMQIKGLGNVLKERSVESLKNVEVKLGIPAAEKLGKVLGQEPEFLHISSEGKPLGMMLMAKNYNTHVTEDATGFVWYLNGATEEYLEKTYKINKNEFDIKVGEALLDTAMARSVGAGKEGSILLHADPSGGDKLLGYYEKKVGFTKVSNLEESPKRISLGRENDGRYFEKDVHRAKNDLGKNREKIGQESQITITQNPATFTKTDMALATAATIAIVRETKESNNTLDQEVLEQRVDKQTYQTLDQTEVQDRQMHEAQKEEKFDNTSKAKEIANRYTQSLGITPVDKEQTYLTEDTEVTNSNVTFDDNSYDVDAQSYNAPTDYISMEISNRLPQQQIEENTLSQEELTDQAAQCIYDDIAQKYGSSNDYDNDYDMGME